MKLYIANCTSQRLDFAFRLPERTQPFKVHIGMGSQALAYSSEMTRPEIDYVLEKAAVYGLVTIEEAERTPGFSGLCYSVDRPMSEDRIRRAMEKRTDVLVEMGRDIRRAAGIGAHNMVENHLNEHQGLGNLHGLKTEVIEQSMSGRPTDGIEERYHFTRQPEDPFAPQAPAKRGGRRGKAA